DQIRFSVAEADLLDHVQHEDRGRTVIAEALPEFDEPDRDEGAGLRSGSGCGGHAELGGRSGKLEPNASGTQLRVRLRQDQACVRVTGAPPPLAGEVGARSAPGEGGAAGV